MAKIEKKQTKGAKVGDTIEVDYTGSFPDGKVFDSSKGRDPLEFTIGEGQLIPGFEEAVIGMDVGQTKKVTLPPEKAYGKTGGHPLAGKTLVFEITIVGIK